MAAVELGRLSESDPQSIGPHSRGAGRDCAISQGRLKQVSRVVEALVLVLSLERREDEVCYDWTS